MFAFLRPSDRRLLLLDEKITRSSTRLREKRISRFSSRRVRITYARCIVSVERRIPKILELEEVAFTKLRRVEERPEPLKVRCLAHWYARQRVLDKSLFSRRAEIFHCPFYCSKATFCCVTAWRERARD